MILHVLFAYFVTMRGTVNVLTGCFMLYSGISVFVFVLPMIRHRQPSTPLLAYYFFSTDAVVAVPCVCLSSLLSPFPLLSPSLCSLCVVV